MSTVSADAESGVASLHFGAPYEGGDQEQVRVTARATQGTQERVIQGWFNRGALEDALAASRPEGREIVLEPAA